MIRIEESWREVCVRGRRRWKPSLLTVLFSPVFTHLSCFHPRLICLSASLMCSLLARWGGGEGVLSKQNQGQEHLLQGPGIHEAGLSEYRMSVWRKRNRIFKTEFITECYVSDGHVPGELPICVFICIWIYHSNVSKISKFLVKCSLIKRGWVALDWLSTGHLLASDDDVFPGWNVTYVLNFPVFGLCYTCHLCLLSVMWRMC